MMPQPEKVLILLVNYFNEGETCSFVREQVLRQDWNNTDVVITDNGSADPAMLSRLAGETNGVYVFASGENNGYLPGAASGLNSYLAKGSDFPDFVIVSNSDIGFEHKNFLGEMVVRTKNSGYDMTGPDIFSDFRHLHQNPLMKERITVRKLKMLALFSSGVVPYYLLLTYHYARTVMAAWFRKDPGNSREIIPVYGIHGSFMIFNRNFFKKGGTLDSPLHLFGEEIYLAEMALAAGIRTGYDPGLKIIHHEHSTTGMYKSRKLVKQMNRSYRYLLEQRKVK